MMENNVANSVLDRKVAISSWLLYYLFEIMPVIYYTRVHTDPRNTISAHITEGMFDAFFLQKI